MFTGLLVKLIHKICLAFFTRLPIKCIPSLAISSVAISVADGPFPTLLWSLATPMLSILTGKDYHQFNNTGEPTSHQLRASAGIISL